MSDEYELNQQLHEDYEHFRVRIEESNGDDIAAILQEANELISTKYKEERRALIKDSELMLLLSSKKTKQVRQFANSVTGEISASDISNLVTKFFDKKKRVPDNFEATLSTWTDVGDKDDMPTIRNVTALGRVALANARIGRGVSHVIGALEKEKPERKKAVRREVDKEVAPQMVVSQVQSNALDASKNNVNKYGKTMKKVLESLYNDLQEGEVLPMWQCIVDPRSFESTVQNFFVFSTLVSGGLVEVEENPEDGMAIVIPASKERHAELAKSRDSRVPIVMELDYDLYEEVLDSYGLRDQEPFVDLGVVEEGINAE